MPDDSGGIYTVPAGTIVNTGDTLLPSQHNPWAVDNATAMSARFSKDGRAPATGNWNLNGFKITNGGAATAATDFVIKSQMAWELISESTFTAVATFDFINLSAFRKLRLTGNASLSSAVGLYLLTSSNNGSSFDNGASDYSIQNIGAQGAGLTASSAVSTALNISSPVGVDASTQATFSVVINIFNAAVTGPHVISQFMGFKTGSIFSEFNAGIRNSAVARNALRLFPGAGTMTGNVTLEGIRG